MQGFAKSRICRVTTGNKDGRYNGAKNVSDVEMQKKPSQALQVGLTELNLCDQNRKSAIDSQSGQYEQMMPSTWNGRGGLLQICRWLKVQEVTISAMEGLANKSFLGREDDRRGKSRAFVC